MMSIQTVLADLQGKVRGLTERLTWLEKNFKIPSERHATLPYELEEFEDEGGASISEAARIANQSGWGDLALAQGGATTATSTSNANISQYFTKVVGGGGSGGDEGWIPHTGTECPVHPKTEVEVNIDGATSKGLAESFYWGEFQKATIVAYKITKPYIEPKPKLKLIDWGMEGMGGCMTNHGTFLSTIGKGEFRSSTYIWYWIKDLRLAPPKDHEGWQSALNFKDVNAVIEKLRAQCVVEETHDDYFVTAFRITGLAEGYTDDPSKAGV